VSNDVTRAEWTGKAELWVRHERIYDAAFAAFTRAVIDAAELGPGLRVLDVGCGAGTVLERAVAAGADAVGIDLSPQMAAAAHARVPGADVLTADAQTAPVLQLAPGVPFDRIVSRFGVMFFADPVAAFTNLRAAAAPGARLAFVSWRDDEDEMFRHGTRRLAARLDDPPEPPRVGQPGPLGLAGEDHIRTVLADSGWTDIRVEPVDGMCDFSVDGSDGVEERLTVALAGRIGQAARERLEPTLGPDGWRAALDDARAELRATLVDGTVRFVSRTWLVTAANPAAVTVPDEVVHAVLRAAIESGGVAGWADIEHWDGHGHADIVECGGSGHVVDVGVVRRGFEVLLADTARDRNDRDVTVAGDVDEDLADTVVQFGLFGRLVYSTGPEARGR